MSAVRRSKRVAQSTRRTTPVYRLVRRKSSITTAKAVLPENTEETNMNDNTNNANHNADDQGQPKAQATVKAPKVKARRNWKRATLKWGGISLGTAAVATGGYFLVKALTKTVEVVSGEA